MPLFSAVPDYPRMSLLKQLSPIFYPIFEAASLAADFPPPAIRFFFPSPASLKTILSNIESNLIKTDHLCS